MSTQAFSTADYHSPLAKLGQQIALAGLGIYVLFAPHSVAASAIGVAVAGIGWLIRILTGSGKERTRRQGDAVTGRTSPWPPVSVSPHLRVSHSPRLMGLRLSRFDLLIVLLLLWSVASAILSEEPRISIPKLTALWSVFLFYLTRAVLNRRSTLVLVALLVLSGCAGALYSVFDLVRGRGVVVETIGFNSPFHQIGIQPGDTI
ncbi:MAG TPA: hypothetical protein VJM50_20795, partial [Pyrinomonadaceae bacterium]|nr:hypothetical protein [Pyrinomonadaceae bacterium]